MTTTTQVKRVLLVDDDPTMLDFMRSQLDPTRVEVTTLQSGSEAIARLETERFDMAVVDAMIPDANGLAVTRAIRARHSSVQFPILVVSAFFRRDRDQGDLLKTWDVQGFLCKPFVGAVFRQEVNRLLGIVDERRTVGVGQVIDLRQRYLADLRASMDQLRRRLPNQGGASVVQFLDEVLMKAHRIKGSAGSYGFPEIQDLACQMESLARSAAKLPTAMSAADWTRLEFLIDHVERKIAQVVLDRRERIEGNTKGKSVYLGIDAMFLQRFRAEAAGTAMEIVRVNTATEAFQTLRSDRVDLLIIDLDHYQNTASDLIRTAKSIAGSKGFLVACAGTKDDTVTRVMVGRNGGDVYQLKSAPMAQLLEALESANQWKRREQKTILVVDDDEFQLELLRKVLTDAEWTVKGLKDPASLIKTAREVQPAVILLDQEMPGLKGAELCRALKMDERLRSIPIILLSAHDDDEMRFKALQAGAVEFITKGTSVRELKVRLRNIVGHFSPQDDPRSAPSAAQKARHAVSA